MKRMQNLSWRLSVATILLFLVGALPIASVAATELPDADPQLQAALQRVANRMSLTQLVAQKRVAISLYELSGSGRYAGINDHEMIYAASLPKIAVLLAAFEKIAAGGMRYGPAEQTLLTQMIRNSSNAAASAAIQRVGFQYIAKTLTADRYRLYDREHQGGLWIGKGYGGPNDRWQRDPLNHLSHAANTFQVTRFFAMMDRGELVTPKYSAEMKRILSHPAIFHKFVKGLANRPGRTIYRKSGTWKDWHADAALVEAGDKRYIAVALAQAPNGGDILVRLIRELDSLVVRPLEHFVTATATTSQSLPPRSDARPLN
jgi:beta-lactamase class A